MADPMTAEDALVVVGQVTGLYGVLGWVRIYSHTQPRENVLHYGRWHLGGPGRWRPVKVEAARTQGKGLVAKFAGVDDRDAARAWIGREIAVPRDELPPLEEGEYYWSDLLGLQVLTVDGQVLGQVARLMETGANDVLVVQGDRERLIPFLPDRVVRRVDLEAGVVEVDWDPDF